MPTIIINPALLTLYAEGGGRERFLPRASLFQKFFCPGSGGGRKRSTMDETLSESGGVLGAIGVRSLAVIARTKGIPHQVSALTFYRYEQPIVDYCQAHQPLHLNMSFEGPPQGPEERGPREQTIALPAAPTPPRTDPRTPPQ
ncbi:hypothetical protein AAFF_G00389840 [Aldrovandia affinis]|uniref:Uncharacterized protein n=1 Tax=Aldrovandia affinis TaxID=143900 RepID=A0AAD7SEB6_9TELE|nr:hypothetical protein AAFF_G00389840 [Aldrovandia affinis]